MRELKLEKWGDGRWKRMVMFCHTVALGAEPTWEICLRARDPEFRKGLAQLEDKQKWISNYRKQSAFFMPDPNLARNFFKATQGDANSELLGESIASAHEWVDKTEAERKLFAKELAARNQEAGMTWDDLLDAMRVEERLLKRVYRGHLREIEADIENKWPSNSRLTALVTESQELRFFFLVTIPCWLEHGVSPKYLFERAQRGNFDAMCKLLSIDPYCTEDSVLAEQRIKLLENSNDHRRAILASASSLRPLEKLTRIRVKFLLAAYIYKICEAHEAKSQIMQKWLLKHEVNFLRLHRFPLSYPQLRALFDAAYADMYGDGTMDPDFAELEPDAFRKRVNRHLSFWPDVA